jgi:23S rRNA (adenine2503-C2)-methyltransferase
MPINKKYPLHSLISALTRFPLPKGRRITLEYVMIAGVNDSNEDAEKLKRIAAKFPSKINLIPFNECSDISLQRPSLKVVERFAEIVRSGGHSVFIRESRGADIMAACGQLKEIVITETSAL